MENLSVNVVAADYSKALDKLVYVSAEPNELHLYDPSTQADTFVQLALAPTSVSVDSNGTYAAVGHDGWISDVNLQANPMTVQAFPVAADVTSLAAGDGGYIYFSSSLEPSQIFALNTTSGTVTAPVNIDGAQTPKLDSSSDILYVGGDELSRWDLSHIPPASSASSAATCGNLWLAEDALRVYTGCGNAYDASSIVANGSLSTEGITVGTVQWLADSATNHSLAVIPLHPPGTNGDLIDSQLAFLPSAAGSRSATLTFSDSAYGGTQSVALTGTGVLPPPPLPTAQAAPAGLHFGSEGTGIPSPSQTITFTDTSSLAISFARIGISGSAASDFRIEGNSCETSLPGGNTCRVTVEFLPTSAGLRTASLTFSDNASGSSQSVSLDGIGMQYLRVSGGSMGPI
ncbi:MAG: choice-of-anchor D domain-containing protein, partial [Terriglobia bacterium]